MLQSHYKALVRNVFHCYQEVVLSHFGLNLALRALPSWDDEDLEKAAESNSGLRARESTLPVGEFTEKPDLRRKIEGPSDRLDKNDAS